MDKEWIKTAVKKYGADVIRRTIHSNQLEADCPVSHNQYKEAMSLIDELERCENSSK